MFDWNGVRRKGQVVIFGGALLFPVLTSPDTDLTSEGFMVGRLELPEPEHDHGRPTQAGLDLGLNVAVTQLMSGGYSGAYPSA